MILKFYTGGRFRTWCSQQLYSYNQPDLLWVLGTLIIIAFSMIAITYYGRKNKVTLVTWIIQYLMLALLLIMPVAILVINESAVTPKSQGLTKPMIAYSNNSLAHSNSDFEFNNLMQMLTNKENIGAINYKREKLIKMSWIDYNRVKLTSLNQHGQAVLNLIKYTDKHYKDKLSSLTITGHGARVKINDSSIITLEANKNSPDKLTLTRETPVVKTSKKIVIAK